ncbi:MAG: terminase large subunit [Candidatus Riflebacteria bacterium]|nr:terminase large subunit [Candidatus Riflebacteria bacterium]
MYTNWEKQEFDNSCFDNYFNGLDFGFADDPTAFIRCHYDKKHKTIYVVDEFYRQAMFIDEVAEELKTIVGGELVTCDSSEPRSIADLKRHGIRALGAKKGAGSIEHGVKWLQSHKLVVHPRCINTIKELTSYKWREDKDGNVIPKPVDMNNHLLDALRYGFEMEMKQNKMKSMSKSILGI